MQLVPFEDALRVPVSGTVDLDNKRLPDATQPGDIVIADGQYLQVTVTGKRDLGEYAVYYEDGEWKVKRLAAKKPSHSFDKKSEAEEMANALASRRNEIVVVFKKNGKLQNEYKPR